MSGTVQKDKTAGKTVRPELLLPAGDRETMETAIAYGADAVYLGGKSFGLRAKAGNFTYDEMADAVAFARSRGVKVYVTANILAHDTDLKKAPDHFKELSQIRPDGLLIADPGLYRLSRIYCPDIDIHISTQANNTNTETVLFWKELGVKRIVLARELSLAEIRDIRRAVPRSDMELEVFVHGAMCMSYSGRCLLSNYLTGRDANRGLCSHPCRFKYALVEETRPGVYIPVEEDGRGTAIMSSEDLCMIEHVPELMEAGIDSLKIEGRMKTALYVATVARAYRRAIDSVCEERFDEVLPGLKKELELCTHRPYGTGFFFGKPENSGGSGYIRGAVYLGTVLSEPHRNTITLRQYNKFCKGDMIEVLLPDGRNVRAVVDTIRDLQTGGEQDSAPHPRQELLVDIRPVGDTEDAPPFTGCVIRTAPAA